MGFRYNTIWYLTLEPYLGRKFSTTEQTNKVFICPASPNGGYSGFLTYAQNNYINAVESTQVMSLRDIPHPAWTIMFGETDGYDACVYADTDPYGGNVCYRHSGGNEHSVFSTVIVEGGVPGQKPKLGRANLVFLDTHVELRRNAPTNIFDPKTPFPALNRPGHFLSHDISFAPGGAGPGWRGWLDEPPLAGFGTGHDGVGRLGVDRRRRLTGPAECLFPAAQDAQIAARWPSAIAWPTACWET